LVQAAQITSDPRNFQAVAIHTIRAAHPNEAIIPTIELYTSPNLDEILWQIERIGCHAIFWTIPIIRRSDAHRYLIAGIELKPVFSVALAKSTNVDLVAIPRLE
jgi:hypothetical protein